MNRSPNPRRRLLAMAPATLLLGACASPKLADYSADKPLFDFQGYFNGALTAHGMVTDRGGKVLRRMVVKMQCTWDKDTAIFDEQFVYDDGERQQRVWRIKKMPDGGWSGKADDVIGEATGASSGAAFYWTYTLKVAARGSEWHIDFDDWMHRVDDKTVINRAVMSKFGVRVGEVLISFQKH